MTLWHPSVKASARELHRVDPKGFPAPPTMPF